MVDVGIMSVLDRPDRLRALTYPAYFLSYCLHLIQRECYTLVI